MCTLLFSKTTIFFYLSLWILLSSSVERSLSFSVSLTRASFSFHSPRGAITRGYPCSTRGKKSRKEGSSRSRGKLVPKIVTCSRAFDHLLLSRRTTGGGTFFHFSLIRFCWCCCSIFFFGFFFVFFVKCRVFVGEAKAQKLSKGKKTRRRRRKSEEGVLCPGIFSFLVFFVFWHACGVVCMADNKRRQYSERSFPLS